MASACTFCGTDNAPAAAYCRGCGRSLALTSPCPSCGADNPVASKFCSSCGRPLYRPGVREEEPLPARAIFDAPGQGAATAGGHWAELAQLVRELSDSPPSPPAPVLGLAPSPVATAEPPRAEVLRTEIALAECMTGSGRGPALAVSVRVAARMDHEKTMAHMANALPVPAAAAKVARRRPPWRGHVD